MCRGKRICLRRAHWLGLHTSHLRFRIALGNSELQITLPNCFLVLGENPWYLFWDHDLWDQ